MTETIERKKVAGFIENGFGMLIIAVCASCMASMLSAGGTGFDAVASNLVQMVFRIALGMILIQAVLEVFGKESLLLRSDWQRFSGMATGIGMMACAAAVMTTMIPLLIS